MLAEHLPILERFALYIDDINNWKRPRGYGDKDISEDAYYYTKNHKFKIVRHEPNPDSLLTIFQVIDYYQLLMDTCISEDYWQYRKNNGACYDDHYEGFNVELWADNTLIEVFGIKNVYLKHYNYDRYRQGFYLPDRGDILKTRDCIKSKEDFQETLEWKICELLFKYDFDPESVYANKDASIILDELNYDYLSAPCNYLKKNKDLLYTSVSVVN